MDIKQKMIEYLLKNANPSIVYRVRSEVLEDLTAGDTADYQAQILTDPMIMHISAMNESREILSFKGLNRVIFDKYSSVKYLAEKAVTADTAVMKNAINRLLPIEIPYVDESGKARDEFKYPCSEFNASKYACMARAGFENARGFTDFVRHAVDSFRRVTEVDTVFDIMEQVGKGVKTRYVFKDYEKWPCRNYLDILAHTSYWRSAENVKIVADSVREMMRTDDCTLVSYVPGGYSEKVGCHGGIFPAQGLTVMGSGVYPSPIMCALGKNGRDYNGKYHFELIEWFARCGVVSSLPKLSEVVDEIADSIDEIGICRLQNIAEDVFKSYGKFGGQQLEVDWKSRTRRDCDITFRALLILHYSGVV